MIFDVDDVAADETAIAAPTALLMILLIFSLIMLMLLNFLLNFDSFSVLDTSGWSVGTTTLIATSLEGSSSSFMFRHGAYDIRR
jgi:hypothetical protein